MSARSVLRYGMTAAALLLSCRLVGAEPVKIRLAWIVPVSNIAEILFAKAGIAQHLGKSYVMEPVRYQGTPPMITAMAVGELEVGLLGYSSLGLAIQNAGMDDLRVFADEVQDGADGSFSNIFAVRADSPIQKVEDLKGKVLATNAAGSAVDIAMRAMLRRAKLQENRDYTVVEAGFGAMRAMLSEKKVDLIPSVLPFAYDPELQKTSRVLFTQKDAMGVSELAIWVAKDSFLKKNRAAVVDFLEDSMRALRWYLDPKNHDEAVKIAAAAAKVPPSMFQDWLFTKRDVYRDPSMLPNVVALQSNFDTQKELGFLSSKIDAKTYIDTSYVEEATKRLKQP